MQGTCDECGLEGECTTYCEHCNPTQLVDRARSERSEVRHAFTATSALMNYLLAKLHQDEGQHTAKVGLQRSVQDAVDTLADEREWVEKSLKHIGRLQDMVWEERGCEGLHGEQCKADRCQWSNGDHCMAMELGLR